jgi:hypothetical protein
MAGAHSGLLVPAPRVATEADPNKNAFPQERILPLGSLHRASELPGRVPGPEFSL